MLRYCVLPIRRIFPHDTYPVCHCSYHFSLTGSSILPSEGVNRATLLHNRIFLLPGVELWGSSDICLLLRAYVQWDDRLLAQGIRMIPAFEIS